MNERFARRCARRDKRLDLRTMNPRFRFFGALLALLALTAYFAEGLWASMCPPEMPMPAAGEVVEREAAPPDCPMEVTRPSSNPTESSEPPGSHVPACPLGPLGVSGTCVAASLPATVTQLAPFLSGDAQLSFPPDTARELLLAAAFFHPPKA
jgi:hypothetical protein